MIANKLRKSIIQAAIQGCLTPKNIEGERVEQLLDQLRAEKESKIRNKEIRRRKLKEIIIEEEYPYDIPNSWCYIRLGELGDFRKGPFGSALKKSIFVKDSERSIKVYEQKNAIQKSTELGEYFITNEYYESKMKGFTVNGGDIIISCAGTIGETYILPKDCRVGIINQALMRVRLYSEVNPNFFKYLFEYILNSKGDKKGKGSAIKNIPPFDILLNFVVGIPTTNEQKRIVEKLDQILPMIDALEKDEIKLKDLVMKFPDSMKASILQAALQGKLTEQLESDKDAKELHQEIIQKIQEEVKQKSIKKLTYNMTISDEEIPYDIPSNWIWVRLGSILKCLGSGGTPSRSESTYWKNGNIPWLKISDVKSKYISKAEEFITELGMTKSSAKLFPKGTLLYTIYATIGDCGILAFESTTNQAIAGLTFVDNLIKTEYMYYVMIASKDRMMRNSRGMAQNNINQKILKDLIVPLPPLEEQKRIVEKLDTLLPLLDDLRVAKGR